MPLAVLVTARDEGECIGGTLAALREAFPAARLLVADDASADRTAHEARRAGAEVVRVVPRRGKGGAAELGLRTLLAADPAPAAVLLCDADLGASAARLGPLVDAVEAGGCHLAVAVFARPTGGGFGLAVGAGRRTVRALTGRSVRAPLSGQRAIGAEAARAALPLAAGFGLEVGMTVDVLRAGLRMCEIELELTHRATGRDPSGFAHRALQLRDVLRAGVTRRRVRDATRRDRPPSR